MVIHSHKRSVYEKGLNPGETCPRPEQRALLRGFAGDESPELLARKAINISVSHKSWYKVPLPPERGVLCPSTGLV
jgi:hypothetical protein